jgi:hypothetical protein
MTNSNVRLIDLQTMPFHQVLPLIVNMDDRVFWRIINWLADQK